MDWMIDWMPQPAVQALGQVLMHSMWQGSLIALGLAVALGLMRRKPAHVRYAASLGAMALLAVSSAATLAYCWPSGHIAAVAGPAPEALAVAVLPPAAGPAVGFWASALGYLNLHAPLLVSLWAMGVVAFSLRLMASYWLSQRLRTYRVAPAPAQWQERLSQLSQRMGIARPVALLESALARTPMTVGHWKPVVLMPLGLLANMPPEQVEAVLAHELAHIRRYDYLLNLLQSLVEVLFFFHPVVWWMSAVVREEREHACDDLALSVCGSQVAFARALARIEESRQPLLQAAMAWARDPQLLLRRIQRILGQYHPTFRWPDQLAVGSLLLLAVCSLAFRQPEPKEAGSGWALEASADPAAWGMAEGDTVKKKRRKQAAVAPEAAVTPTKAPRMVVVVEEDVEIDTVARGKAPVMVWVDVEDGDTLRKRRVHRVVVAPPAPDGFHFDFDFDFDVAEMAPMPEMPMMVWEFNSALDSPAVRAKLDSLRAQAEQVRAAYREAMSEYAQERQKHREEIHVERRRITEEERERIRAEAERAREEAREVMEEAREEMEQAREEMREEMAKAREGMEVSRQKHEASMRALRKDLAADGLLSDEGAPLQLYLSKRQLLVNGKEATEAQRAKYLERFKREMGAKEGNSWSFSYPNTQLMIDLD